MQSLTTDVIHYGDAVMLKDAYGRLTLARYKGLTTVIGMFKYVVISAKSNPQYEFIADLKNIIFKIKKDGSK